MKQGKENNMKKTKIKMLSIAACLALVGTASAAWVYAGTASASADIGVKVASYADAGTVTVTGNDKIHILLDKDSVTYVKDSEDVELTAKHNVPEQFKSESKTINKKFSVTIPAGLADYIAFADDTNKYVSYREGDNKPIRHSYAVYEWVDDTDIFDSLPALAWVSGKCPSGESDYKMLINKIQDNAITDDNWGSVQNKEWNATEMNSEWCVTINFYANVD